MSTGYSSYEEGTAEPSQASVLPTPTQQVPNMERNSMVSSPFGTGGIQFPRATKFAVGWFVIAVASYLLNIIIAVSQWGNFNPRKSMSIAMGSVSLVLFIFGTGYLLVQSNPMRHTNAPATHRQRSVSWWAEVGFSLTWFMGIFALIHQIALISVIGSGYGVSEDNWRFLLVEWWIAAIASTVEYYLRTHMQHF